MNLEFKGSFVKDLKKIKEKQLQGQIRELIEKVEASANITELESMKKLSGSDVYYRIRLGDYRVGLKIEILPFILFGSCTEKTSIVTSHKQ